MEKFEWKVKWMECGGCATALQNSLSKNDWIQQINVTYANHSIFLEYDPNKITLNKIKQQAQDLGYPILEAESEDNIESEENKEIDLFFWKMVVALVLTAVVVLLAMWLHMSWTEDFVRQIPLWLNYGIQFVFTAIVMFWSGFYIYRSCIKSLLKWVFNMNVLVWLGTLAAFLVSIAGILFPGFFLQITDELPVYFEAAAGIAAFIITWRYLEEKAKKSTKWAVNKLISMQEKKAIVMIDNEEKQVDIDKLNLEDNIVIKPGEKVPADALIIKGEWDFDESAITWESKPANKMVDDKIFAWSVNNNWYIIAKVTTKPGNSVLDNIVKLIQQAQSRKPAVQNIADLVSSYFVPLVITVAVITFVVWFLWWPDPRFNYALLTSISVLVIACPCALWLATPTALTVGLWKSANKGLLVKSPEVFENISKISDVFFDKTGTLTMWEFEVVEDIYTQNTLEETEIKKIVYLAEKKSTHPIAKSITNYLEQDKDFQLDIELENFENVSGGWIKAVYKNTPLLIWSLEFLSKNQIDQASDYKHLKEWWKTVVGVAYGENLEAVFLLEDKINPQSKELISFLHNRWINTWIVSGDSSEVVENVANRMWVTGFYSEMLPDQKYQKIQEYQQDGRKVMMVWDGINDSPSLSLADISVAVGSWSDIAIWSGDVVLLWNNIWKIQTLFETWTKTMRVIKQNLFWAFVYNIALIPVAAGLIYPVWGIILNPMFAGLAMALSSISVVMNSLRLKLIN